MTELSKEELAVYKLQLLKLKEEILSAATILDESSAIVELDQTRVGRLSRMDAMQGQAMSKAMQERNEQQLREINSALKRIELEEFGYCLRCDDDIARQRIDIYPAVRHCIKCAD